MVAVGDRPETKGVYYGGSLSNAGVFGCWSNARCDESINAKQACQNGRPRTPAATMAENFSGFLLLTTRYYIVECSYGKQET
jgi:hypothetical protein